MLWILQIYNIKRGNNCGMYLLKVIPLINFIGHRKYIHDKYDYALTLHGRNGTLFRVEKRDISLPSYLYCNKRNIKNIGKFLHCAGVSNLFIINIFSKDGKSLCSSITNLAQEQLENAVFNNTDTRIPHTTLPLKVDCYIKTLDSKEMDVYVFTMYYIFYFAMFAILFFVVLFTLLKLARVNL